MVSREKNYDFMKYFILSTLIIISVQVATCKICAESKCSMQDDKYICLNANLTFIPVGAINAELVDLSGNYYPYLESNEFAEFTRLKVLILSNVSLKLIHREAFKKQKYLEYLDLSMNHLKSLHPDTFEDNIIQHLNLSGNIFKKLVNYQFPMPQLEKLDLSYGFLKDIPEYAFANCSSLKWLNLSENKFKTMPLKQVLLSCPRLEVLMLHNNSWSCDCDFYLMSKTLIISQYSDQLRCEIDREYTYANNTNFLKPTCESYLTKLNYEIASGNVDRNSRDENAPNLILNIYGYVICGITILIAMCCCCKKRTINRANAPTAPSKQTQSSPFIDHLYHVDFSEPMKSVKTQDFERCEVEIHQESDANFK